ncbi:MAG: hypothetical protein WA418_38670, partial [Bradyrhizobium sp.]
DVVTTEREPALAILRRVDGNAFDDHGELLAEIDIAELIFAEHFANALTVLHASGKRCKPSACTGAFLASAVPKANTARHDHFGQRDFYALVDVFQERLPQVGLRLVEVGRRRRASRSCDAPSQVVVFVRKPILGDRFEQVGLRRYTLEGDFKKLFLRLVGVSLDYIKEHRTRCLRFV